MSTMELDARRAEIIRRLFDTDSMEVLDSVKRSLTRALHRESRQTAVKEDLTPYTMEELNARLDEAEAEEGGTPSEEFFYQLEQEFPFLCKYK